MSNPENDHISYPKQLWKAQYTATSSFFSSHEALRHQKLKFPKNILFSFNEVNLFCITAYHSNPKAIDSLFLIRLFHWENGNMGFQNYVSNKKRAGFQDLGLCQIVKVIL